jgi:uncharacterized membrane protein (UPF0127 family)
MMTLLPVLSALLLMLMSGCGSNIIASAPEVQFTKEGELSFFRQVTGEKIAQIDIEIADTPAERTQGLMDRRYLPPNAGMLFIFDSPGPLSFWMKNTYIPLDIIFISEAKTIVSIAKNTTPLSEALIPSGEDAMYVVEVNAGFCDRYGIAAGDAIDFVRIRNDK